MNATKRLQTYINDRNIKAVALNGSLVRPSGHDDHIYYTAVGLSRKQLRRVHKKYRRDQILTRYGVASLRRSDIPF